MTTPPELAGELAAIRAMLADHERRLYPVDRRALPAPDRYIKSTGVRVAGHCWKPAPRWAVIYDDTDPDSRDTVYVQTPHSLHDPGTDAIAVTLDQALLLAASLVAAVEKARPSGENVLLLRPKEAS